MHNTIKEERSGLIKTSINMRQQLSGGNFDELELLDIYSSRSMIGRFRHDAQLGGYVPHIRKLRKRNYFI